MWSHTVTHHSRRTSYRPVAEAYACNNTQHSQETSMPCHRRNSNPKSQQASGHRLAPSTPRPPVWSAEGQLTGENRSPRKETRHRAVSFTIDSTWSAPGPNLAVHSEKARDGASVGEAESVRLLPLHTCVYALWARRESSCSGGGLRQNFNIIILRADCRYTRACFGYAHSHFGDGLV